MKRVVLLSALVFSACSEQGIHNINGGGDGDGAVHLPVGERQELRLERRNRGSRPGEESRQPIELTPLGERLVGLVAWEESGVIP